MKKIKTLVVFFLVMVLMGMLGRSAFYVVYRSFIAANGETGFLPMLWHGLQLDIAIAGYVTLLPTLLVILAQWWNGRALLWVWRIYTVIIVAGMTIAFVANISLYRYWGFPLDSTPLFFLENSPKEFLACLTWWQMVFGPIFILLLIAALGYASDWLVRPKETLGTQDGCSNSKKGAVATLLCLLLIGLEFLGIRGGIGVSVNNIGKVYFSKNIRLNHAAVNPVFSFIDSVLDVPDFAHQYRFMDDKQADRLFSQMVYTQQRETPDSLLTSTFKDALTSKDKGVRVIIIIMESFSRYIMSDGGHGITGVTPHLEKLAAEGVYFTNFYANSFRTDRGTMAILSGFPAQPTMSLMKYPHKTNNLYSIARSLHKAGYSTQYVFGSDANFTNCRSYLRSTGVDDVIAEEDYPLSIHRDKWGVADGYVFNRALEEAKKDKDSESVFRIVQTSSSHEPFDVPWHKLKDEALNAFNYADNCIEQYVNALRARPDWDRTLIVLVPDHLGSYPDQIDHLQPCSFQIPLIFTGGAVAKPRRIGTYGSQIDIAATLLTLLGIHHEEFTYSKDLLDPKAPHFAYFDVPDDMGMADETGVVIYDNPSGQTVYSEGEGEKKLPYVKAYLQKLYDDIARR